MRAKNKPRSGYVLVLGQINSPQRQTSQGDVIVPTHGSTKLTVGEPDAFHCVAGNQVRTNIEVSLRP